MVRKNISSQSRAQTSDYRRGTVMGLTVAEVFILISFVLLMLLMLWQSEERERTQPAMDFFDSLEPAQRSLIINGINDEWLDSALEKEKSQTQIDKTSDLIANLPEDELAILNGLITDGTLVPAHEAQNKINEGAVLVEKREIAELAEAISNLPEIDRSSFEELVRIDNYQQAVEWALKVSTLLDEDVSLNDIDNALEIATGFSPEELEDVDALKEAIRQSIEKTHQIGEDVAQEIDSILGEHIRSVGGEIDARTGAITLPESALFKQGEYKLTPRLKLFLNAFCVPWIEALGEFGDDISAVRIEGHASSEWSGAVDQNYAYISNMTLSQRRASTVLNQCLKLLETSEALFWSRERLVAVGFSSSHPIETANGEEDFVRSRRVVFRIDINSENLIDKIRDQVSSSSE